MGAVVPAAAPRPSRRALLVGLAVVLAALAGLLGTWSVASAHAELVSTSPTSGSVLPTSPNQIVLTFSESVDPVPDSIRVVAGDGSVVDIGGIRQDGGKTTIAADVPTLADGTYVVAWRAVSADSHPVAGAFTFSVGAPSTTDPNLVGDLLDANQPAKPAQAWLAIGRWSSYVGIAVLIGVLWVLAGIWPAGLRTRRSTILLAVAGAVGLAGTALMISAQAAENVDSYTAWSEVIHTQSGKWWLIRLIFVAVALVAVLARRRLRRTPVTLAASWLGGLALLAVVAAGGHASTGRWVVLGMAATVAHLAGMALWLGGLAALAAVVPRRLMVRAAVELSPVALVAVVVLSLSGTVNAWRQSGSWDDLIHSRYGTWLIVKLVLIAGVLGLAMASRWITTTRPGAHGSPRALRRTITAEVLGILVVMVATTGLVSSPPPHALAVTSESASVSVDDRIAQIILSPPVTGGTTMHVTISSVSGSLDSPTSITVSATLPSQSIGPLDIPVEAAGPGHVIATNATFPLAGTWTITVTARYSEFDQTIFTADMVVR